MDNRNVVAELVSIIPQMAWYGGKHLTPLLVGAPGTAKTSFLKRLGEKYTEILREDGLIGPDERYEMAFFALPQTSPDVLEGISVPSEDKTELNRLPLAILRRVANSKYGMIFGDEITSCNPDTGAAFMTLAQDLIAGDLQLHSRITPVFACNPPDQAASGRELSPPEANRFVHLEWKLPQSDFLNYLEGGSGLLNHFRKLPADWEEAYGPRTKGLVANFLKNHPRFVNELESISDTAEMHTQTNEVNTSAAWASQRSWEACARLMAACLAVGERPYSEMTQTAIRGCVGERAGEAFIGWLRNANLPNPEDLVKDPNALQTIKNIPREDHRKLVAEQLVLYVKHEATKNNDVDLYIWCIELLTDLAETNKDNVLGAMSTILSFPGKLTREIINRLQQSGITQRKSFLFQIIKDLGIHRDDI